MKKKSAAAAIGVALGGAALLVSTQGAAQAAPAAPVTTVAAAAKPTPGMDKSPQWLGSVATKAAKAVGKATVHGRAAAGSGASSYQLLGSLYGAPPSGISEDAAASAETVFDR
ncbi:hypothetical protein [Streptomyces sp. JJ38]|uniref:hypothetical protein n=1 Tax=Streptomyces sp. JJ38 TaxID=2738128 RepID=UPI001C58368D|nr:hypothetical protein [Streptomyces sp. JJ38]MBW1596335.1 hypothetical protein [Streptomyces sp. JJ38]